MGGDPELVEAGQLLQQGVQEAGEAGGGGPPHPAADPGQGHDEGDGDHTDLPGAADH